MNSNRKAFFCAIIDNVLERATIVEMILTEHLQSLLIDASARCGEPGWDLSGHDCFDVYNSIL